MDISSLSSNAISMNTKQKTGDTASTAVTTKASDVKVDAAEQLISSTSQPEATESHLGGNFNERA